MSTAPRSATIMTFGDLLDERRFDNAGTCRFCHEWKHNLSRYSARHYVCESCCHRKGRHTVMPHVAAAEKKARKYAADDITSARLIRTLAGVSLDFAEFVITEAQKEPQP